MKDTEIFSEVMQLSEMNVIKLAEGKDGKFQAPSELQMARTGQFFRLWSDGDICHEITITESIIDNMIKNFDDNILKIDLAIDYGHDNEGPAASWIKSLSKRDSVDFPGQIELMCVPRWTKSGKESVEGGDFRYLSIEINGNYRDNQSLEFFGPTLLGAGLTNRPVIKGMQPTSKLSDIQKENNKMNELEKLKEEMKGKESEVTKLSDDNKTLKADTVKLSEENTKLSEENKTLKEEKKNLEKEGKFNTMLSEGKVCEAQRESYLSNDLEKFAELSHDKLNLSEKGTGTGAEEVDTDDEDKVIAAAEKLCAADETLSFSDAVIKVKNEKK